MNKLNLLSVILILVMTACSQKESELGMDCTVGIKGSYNEETVMLLILKYGITNNMVQIERVSLKDLKVGMERLCFHFKLRTAPLPAQEDAPYTDLARATSVFFLIIY